MLKQAYQALLQLHTALDGFRTIHQQLNGPGHRDHR